MFLLRLRLLPTPPAYPGMAAGTLSAPKSLHADAALQVQLLCPACSLQVPRVCCCCYHCSIMFVPCSPSPSSSTPRPPSLQLIQSFPSKTQSGLKHRSGSTGWGLSFLTVFISSCFSTADYSSFKSDKAGEEKQEGKKMP